MSLIDTIEALCNESDKNATEVLTKIKTAIRNEKTPDISSIKDGERFLYKGIEFIRLGEEQGGVLCMVTKPFKVCPFDKNGHNDWRKSSARELLLSKFLPLMDGLDLLPFEMDLIADNGDTAYGKSTDKVGILSCDLYRKYRKIVPLFDDYMWTCTPWYCAGHAFSVRRVGSYGTVYSGHAYGAFALAPACIIRNP